MDVKKGRDLNASHSLSVQELSQKISQERNRFLRDCLETVCNVLATTFVLVTAVDLLLLHLSYPVVLLLIGTGTIVAFLGISRYLSKKTIPLQYANPLAMLIVVCVLANLLLREYLVSSPSNITVLAMFTLSLGVFFLSTPWLIVSLVGTTGLSIWVISARSLSSLHEFLQLQLIAVIFSLVLHMFRGRTFTRMSELRITDEQLNMELQDVVSQSRQNENKFRRISESVPFGIFQVDSQGYCEYSNNIYRSFCVAAGMTTIEHRWVDILPEFCREETHLQWIEAARDYNSYSGVYLTQTISGEDRWLEILVSPVFSDDGAVFVGTVEDITGKKVAHDTLYKTADDLRISKEQLEKNSRRLQDVVEQLEVAKEKAEQSARTKSEFLANMSHEIRTPMTAILGYTDLLLEEISENAHYRDSLQTIKRNGEHLMQIINDILDISKIEAGKMQVEIIPVCPTQIIRDVCELMSVRAQEKGIPLNIEFLTPIPLVIKTDPTRLRQILLNLVSNAIKFTDEGTVLVSARVDQNPTTHAACLEILVRDSGIGMSPEQKAKLFQPFTQADSSMTRRYGGTGLGLTISQRLAQKLGGEISVESQFGQGSVFSVKIETGELPYSETISTPGTCSFDQSGTGCTNPPAPLNPAANSGLNCRLLLAEDGVDNQKLISFLLKKAGAEVTIAENGEIAVEKTLAARAEDNPYEIIIMDMQMPVMDGYTATRTLREHGIVTPIIALTAHAMSGDREKCLAAGCSEFATKPINRQALLEVIRSQLLVPCPVFLAEQRLETRG